MNNFKPKTKLYGREVIGYFDDGSRSLGKLEEIKSPHCFLIDGVEWEVNATDDFGLSKGGKLFLNWPWKS